MSISEVQNIVQYATDDVNGDRTGVLVPLEVWESVMQSWQALLNLYADDKEPNEQILADLKESLRQVKNGQTLPLNELWDKADA